MRLAALAFLCLAGISAAAAASINESPDVAAVLSARLTETVRLDDVFGKFGETIALSARQNGVTDEHFLDAWETVAAETFGDRGLDSRLEASLLLELESEDLAAVDAFFASPLGQRVGELQRAVEAVPRERQVGVVARGLTILLATPGPRRTQLRDVLTLSNAELTFSLLAESLRGMALGLHLAERGDLEVPWEEIEISVARELADIEENLGQASLGTLAYAFEPLSDADLEAYLEFLRAPGTRKFQAITAFVIGNAIKDAMAALGENITARLAAVAI